MLLNHGDGGRVIYCGGNKMLLGCSGHAGHGVVLGQRATSWCCLVLKLAATIHPLGGAIKEKLQLDQQAAKFDREEVSVRQ